VPFRHSGGTVWKFSTPRPGRRSRTRIEPTLRSAGSRPLIAVGATGRAEARESRID